MVYTPDFVSAPGLCVYTRTGKFDCWLYRDSLCGVVPPWGDVQRVGVRGASGVLKVGDVKVRGARGDLEGGGVGARGCRWVLKGGCVEAGGCWWDLNRGDLEAIGCRRVQEDSGVEASRQHGGCLAHVLDVPDPAVPHSMDHHR